MKEEAWFASFSDREWQWTVTSQLIAGKKLNHDKIQELGVSGGCYGIKAKNNF